jgi:hypothetical protein
LIESANNSNNNAHNATKNNTSSAPATIYESLSISAQNVDVEDVESGLQQVKLTPFLSLQEVEFDGDVGDHEEVHNYDIDSEYDEAHIDNIEDEDENSEEDDGELDFTYCDDADTVGLTFDAYGFQDLEQDFHSNLANSAPNNSNNIIANTNTGANTNNNFNPNNANNNQNQSQHRALHFRARFETEINQMLESQQFELENVFSLEEMIPNL